MWRYLLKRDDEEPAPWTRDGKERVKKLGLVMQVRSCRPFGILFQEDAIQTFDSHFHGMWWLLLQYPAGYQKEKENKNEVEEEATPSKAKRKRKSQGSGMFFMALTC